MFDIVPPKPARKEAAAKALTGVAATAVAGSVSITGAANVTLTSVAATAAAGTVTATAGATPSTAASI